MRYSLAQWFQKYDKINMIILKKNTENILILHIIYFMELKRHVKNYWNCIWYEIFNSIIENLKGYTSICIYYNYTFIKYVYLLAWELTYVYGTSMEICRD